jgi:ketosteroid isomerase-like protein
MRSLLAALVWIVLSFNSSARAEDIPLRTCDRLPVVEVTISGSQFLFLLDTGATSMLNLKSFSHGDPRRIAVTSWSGTAETRAQDVTIGDLTIGQHQLKSLRLPAVDLSAIGNACGRRIDGILGVDLLARLGATVDVRNRVAHIAPEPEDTESRIAELHRELTHCEELFNAANEPEFAQCLDPDVVIFTAGGDYYGREASMGYYRQRYFRHDPRAHLQITSRGQHAIGDAIWVEYDLRITLGTQVILARGTALCEKKDGRWRIVHMNHSAPPPDAYQAKED